MRKTLLAAALLPVAALRWRRQRLRVLPAFAATQPRQLDLTGVKAVMFDIGPHDLTVTASPNAKAGVQGKACASDPERLAELTLTQERLRRQAGGDGQSAATRSNINFGGNHYAYLDLKASVPGQRAGAAQGRLRRCARARRLGIERRCRLRRCRCARHPRPGHGRPQFRRHRTRHHRLAATCSRSAPATSARAASRAAPRSAASARATSNCVDVGGDVTVDRIGSGDLDVRDVRGNLTVRRVGSGSVDHSGVVRPRRRARATTDAPPSTSLRNFQHELRQPHRTLRRRAVRPLAAGRLRRQPGSGSAPSARSRKPPGHFRRDPGSDHRGAEGNRRGQHHRRPRTSTTGKKAEITPKGDLLIDGKAVAVTPAAAHAAARIPRPRRRASPPPACTSACRARTWPPRPWPNRSRACSPATRTKIEKRVEAEADKVGRPPQQLCDAPAGHAGLAAEARRRAARVQAVRDDGPVRHRRLPRGQ